MAEVHRTIGRRNLRSPRRAAAAADPSFVIGAAVRRALAAGRPVVALESSVFAQGLPRPANARAAGQMTSVITRAGCVAAITAVVRGRPTVGIAPADLQRFLGRDGVAKVSSRDLAPAILQKSDGATTVAAAILLAHRAGIRVFATGGIGGVHRGSQIDESADLLELSRTPVIVVCAGPKAILDVAATAERLETLGVTVVGYRTDTLPAFYMPSTDLPVTVRVNTVREIAELYAVHSSFRRPGALLVVQRPPGSARIRPKVLEAAMRKGLKLASGKRVRSQRVTPFLLEAVDRATGGGAVEANVELLVANAELAAQIAVELERGAENR